MKIIVIQVGDMIRIGLDKLLLYLDMTKEDLHSFMVNTQMPTLELLAEYLSEDSDICDYCGNNYVHVSEEPICEECIEILQNKSSWR